MCSEQERYDISGLFISHLITNILIKAIMTTNHYQSLLPSEVTVFHCMYYNAHLRLKLEIKNFISAAFPLCEQFLITISISVKKI